MPCRGPLSSHCTLKSCTVKQNGSIWEALKSPPGAKSSYCVRELEKPLPTTRITPPL